MQIFLCEDSVDGIFTGVYDAWASGLGHDNVRLLAGDEESVRQAELFCEYRVIRPDPDKAEKVLRTVKNKISILSARMLVSACCSERKDKAEAVYRFIVLGLKLGRRTADRLTNPYVLAVFEMNRQVGNEVHHYLGFLRFSKVYRNILFAEFEPKSDIAALVAPHFADRLPGENFVICDRRRKKAAVHPAQSPWYMTEVTDELLYQMEKEAGKEEDYPNLWKAFFESIAIEERRNERLQNTLLPKRFRNMMTEFQVSE